MLGELVSFANVDASGCVCLLFENWAAGVSLSKLQRMTVSVAPASRCRSATGELSCTAPLARREAARCCPPSLTTTGSLARAANRRVAGGSPNVFRIGALSRHTLIRPGTPHQVSKCVFPMIHHKGLHIFFAGLGRNQRSPIPHHPIPFHVSGSVCLRSAVRRPVCREEDGRTESSLVPYCRSGTKKNTALKTTAKLEPGLSDSKSIMK
jgi:hypothetical protein